MGFDPTDEKRWIGQLNALYTTIVENPDLPTENLDKANKVILEAIEKMRPLAQTTLDSRSRARARI